MYRKHRNNKLNGEGPPKYKPPPPKKTNSSANRQLNPSYAPPPVTDDRPENQYYNTQTAEPVTLQLFFTPVVIPPFHHVVAVWTESIEGFKRNRYLQLCRANANI
ncbi:hypothetical protein E3U43_020444 [Larimichthys crocea]|uniref:Uncharacterized protein n=1 Tax=Larimichthys crocea TaxID=215358 RepID=A0ACD3QVZ0_LARCR|nr:hypothetical protein E3U43_020444 [Larimichthys crocea]